MSGSAPLVLAIVSGPGSGRRYRLEGRASIGRAAHCSIAIDAPGISREHFELQPEGGEWCVQDSGSRNGTYLNGRAVKRARLHAGDEIRAGDVVFGVQGTSARTSSRLSDASDERGGGGETIAVEPIRLPMPIFEATAPTLDAAAPRPEPGSLLAALTGSLSSDPQVTLYAIVDGAKAFDLAFAGRLMGHEMYTLFSGDLAVVAAQSGPCLLVVRERSGWLRAWLERLGSHAGVLFESTAALEDLGTHLRHVFIAADEEGQEYFFRFYDPRVLRTFLPTCREGELLEFFGPVSRWISEREDASGFAIFSNESGRLRTQDVVAPPPAGG